MMGRMAPLLVLALIACTPKPAPADAPLQSVAGAEQEALEALARELEGRAGEGEQLGGELARALASGSADPGVREAAVELLLWLEEAPADAAAPDDPLDPAGVAAEERATLRGADARVQVARDHLRHGRYRDAIDALAPLEGSVAWPDALPYWEEAVDGHVARERERAGELYMAARRFPLEARVAALEEVREVLDGLLREFPESSYATPLRENLERVERDLEALRHD